MLDHHPLLAPLVGSALSRADYARALAALHAPQAALEELLADFSPSTQFPRRAGDLAADLDALGITPQPLRSALPDAGNAARRLGIMYVLEGSNAGGAVIDRCLQGSLPAGLSRRFFAGAGGRPRWERFWEFAATHCPGLPSEQALAAARETFDFYRRHLDQCL